jgi:type IV pilus assembly protein PilF
MLNALSGRVIAGGRCFNYCFRFLLLISSSLSSSCSAPAIPAAVVDKPAAAQARVRLGLAYLAQGELLLARQNLEQALSYQPQSAQVQGAMALYQQQAGESIAAQRHYQRALQLAPRSGELLHHYATFLCGQRRYSEAQHYFQAALQAPESAYWLDTLHQAGWCYLQSGEPVAARSLLQRALKHHPGQGHHWIERAIQALDEGRCHEAQQGLEIYDVLQPATAESLLLHLRLAASLGDQAALKHYGSRLVREFPRSQQSQHFLKQRYEQTAH